MRKTVILIALLLLTACTMHFDKNPNETNILDNHSPGITYLPKNDADFLNAKEAAQKNIAYFIDALNSFNDSLTYSIKADFVDGDIHEHMWVDTSGYRDEKFFGFVANDPVNIKNYKYGDWVAINKTDVEDWMIWNQATNEYHGYFSREVLRQH